VRDAEAKGLQTCGGCQVRRIKKDPNKDAVWHCSTCAKARGPADGPGPAGGRKARTLTEQKALVAGRRAEAEAALDRLRLRCATPGCALCARSTEGDEAEFCCGTCKAQAGPAHAPCCEGVPWVQPVVVIGLLAASITTEARLTRFRHVLRSALGQELRRGEAEFTVGLSWSSTPALKPKVQSAIDELAALSPSSSLVAQRQSETRSHFQHLRAALDLIQERWLSDGFDAESQQSAWVLFGNDRDLWHHSRVREYSCAVRAHPMVEGVAAVATMARARSLAPEVEHEKLPTTERAVDDDLARGRAVLSGEGKSARAWRRDLDHSGGDAVRLPDNADFELRFFDFCPRLRLLREFFEATSPNVLGHPFCDARCGQFLATYPQMGREMGLAVHFFKPLSNSWIYFHANEGVGHRRRLWQQQQNLGAGEGKSAATATVERTSSVAGATTTNNGAEVEATERKLAADLLPRFRVYDKSLTESKLSQFLTTFRTSVELWLIRYHQCRMGQVLFDEQVVKLAQHAFASTRGATGPQKLSPHTYKICRDVARAEAAYFGVEVDWHSEQDLLTPNIPPDYCEERGKTVFREPPRRVLEKWSGNFKVHKIMRSFVPEARRGEADVIAFEDVHSLLVKVGVGVSDLEAVFGGSGAAQDGGAAEDGGADAGSESILRRFVARQPGIQGALHFTDVYRMLVVAGLDLRRFLSRLGGDSGDGSGGDPGGGGEAGEDAAAAAREAQDDGDDDDDGGAAGPRIGNYRVIQELGRGMGCSTVYLAEHVAAGAAAGAGAAGQSPAAAQVALKWPVEAEEVEVMREVQRQQAEGLPGLLAAGVHEGEHWFASELLGADLHTVFQCLSEHPLEERWGAVRVIGRMVLRRLEVLHRSGYVHGDVATQNVLLGRARGGGGGQETAYLIDFGCARRFPGSGPVPAEKVGSMEFSSVASAEGRARRPEDDLEALGWVLVNGVFGELPWFEWLGAWYAQPGQTSFRFERVARRVQGAKSRLLGEGWGSLGPKYAGLAGLPDELARFIRECQAPVEPPGLPDYARLAGLLGGLAHLPPGEAEASDRRQYRDKVATLLDQAHPLLGLMLKAAQVDAVREFSKGDSVQVWSTSRNTWIEDGVVDEVAHQDLVAHGRQLPGVATLFAAANIDLESCVVPRGSVHVLYGAGAGEKWILPWEQKELVRRRVPGVGAARPAMTAVAA